MKINKFLFAFTKFFFFPSRKIKLFIKIKVLLYIDELNAENYNIEDCKTSLNYFEQ